MGDVVQNADREFWRAPVVPVVETSANIAEACTGCGTEFIMGAGFCHVCGADRHKVASALVANCSWTRLFEAVQVWRIEWLLSAAVAFLAGILLKNQN